jgi:hypothetical protein
MEVFLGSALIIAWVTVSSLGDGRPQLARLRGDQSNSGLPRGLIAGAAMLRDEIVAEF